MTREWCPTCGGPRWRDSEKYASGIMGRRWQRWETVDGCRLCWLHLPTLPRRQPIEWRGLTVDAANSADNSPATSTWLPVGCREMSDVWRRVVDRDRDRPAHALGHWLRGWAITEARVEAEGSAYRAWRALL